jgi:hypothetical protein
MSSLRVNRNNIVTLTVIHLKMKRKVRTFQKEPHLVYIIDEAN